MIKFNWKKINDRLDWDKRNVLLYFCLKQNLRIPKYLPLKIPRKVKNLAKQPYPIGFSYLINPNEVILNSYSEEDLYLYIQLASKRSLFEYKTKGNAGLPIVFMDEYQKSWADVCPLIIVKQNTVYFIYEQE